MPTRRRSSPGSFSNDLERLLEQLNEPPLIELGRPAPDEKYLPKAATARCPAAHNDALLDGTDR